MADKNMIRSLRKSTASMLCACLLSASVPADIVFAQRALPLSQIPNGNIFRSGVFVSQMHLLKLDVLSGLRTLNSIASGTGSTEEVLSARRILALAAEPSLAASSFDTEVAAVLRDANRILIAEKNKDLLTGLSSFVTALRREQLAQGLNSAYDNNEPLLDGDDESIVVKGVESTEELPEAKLSPSPNKDSSATEEATSALFRLRQDVKMDAYRILRTELGGDVGDGILHHDIERILRRLLKAAGLPREAAQIFTGNSMLPNAFTTIVKSEGVFLENNADLAKAFRVSNIFVSLGLLRSMESEDQLAFIIAHELMHNWKSHLKDFSGVGQQLLGHFHEMEADAEGLKLAAAAGYQPQAAIDSLYALDREYDRLEKEYTLLKRDKSELAQILQRLRDVHPHSDIRRANMMDHMNQANEAFKPSIPAVGVPIWMTRRLAEERSSHIDRFAARLKQALAGRTLSESIYSLETFIEHESANAAIDGEKYAIIDEAYRKLLKRVDAIEGLRPIEISMNREKRGDFFPSHRLRSDMISRQLDILFKGIDEPMTLAKFLRAAVSLSEETRRAGTLRILGTVKDREQLDAIYKVLSAEAENLGLDIRKMNEESRSTFDLKLDVGTRIWRATRRVLSAELKRPALPEEIIAELIMKLSPSWLKTYHNSIQVEIIESAFGPEASRSKKYRPSQLASLLRGTLSSFKVDRPWGTKKFEGLEPWSQRHYTPPAPGQVNGKTIFVYERYHLDGLSSPSIQDQIDITEWFGSGLFPPAAVRLLREEGKLDAYITAFYSDIGAELKRRLKGVATSEERRDHLDWYQSEVGGVLRSVLYNLRDFKTIRETTAAAWKQVELLIESPEINAAYGESNRSQLAFEFFYSLSAAIRQAVVGIDLAGSRPDFAEIRKTATLVAHIEKFLRAFPSSSLVKAYAANLGAHIGKDHEYMAAYDLAIPKALGNRETRYKKWLAKEHSRMTKPLVFILRWIDASYRAVKDKVLHLQWVKKRRGKPTLAGIPEASLRPLDTNDYVHFLAMIGDPQTDTKTKLMAAALLDRLDIDHGWEEADLMGKAIGMRAAAVAGRWLFEDVSTASERVEDLPATATLLLRLNDLHPGLFNPDFETTGTTTNAFRQGAEYIKRNEAYRSVAKGEHPFRGVNTRWALNMAKRLDAAHAWPKDTADRVDLLDFFNSNGEFSDELDKRIIDTANADPEAFRKWVKKDRKRLKRLTVKISSNFSDGYSFVNTPFGNLPVPKAQPLKIVRNPALRTKLFDLMPESNFGEKPLRRSLPEWYRATRRLIAAYFRARKHFSAKFLKGLRGEGSLEDKIFDVLEEIDRNATEQAKQARERWDKGAFTKDDLSYLKDVNLSEREWPTQLPHEKDEVIKGYKERVKGTLKPILLELYNAFAGLEDPVLGLIVDNYPEPTRSRDDLLERLIKARRLSPGSLSHLESNKSYRQPNPVRVMEKHLLDQAVIQMRKFSPAEKVDILLHLAKIERLSLEKKKAFNKRILSGERKKMARDNAALRSIFQLENYMSLLHSKDRALLTRALFYGEGALHKAPAEVERLFERLVIVGRDLPPFMEKTFRAYFKILTEDERAKFIADIAALDDVGPELKGPEIVSVALRGMGVTGKKVAQVLATHKGLVPAEYVKPLEIFKDRAQNMEKMRSYSLITERLAAIAGRVGERSSDKTGWTASAQNWLIKSWDRLLSTFWKSEAPAAPSAAMTDEQLDALSYQALPSDNEEMSLDAAARQRLIRQVSFLLKEQKAKVRWITEMGPELGAGSIKLVYKVVLEDKRTWVVKLRAPGAAYGTKREFELFDELINTMQSNGDLNLPAAGQLLDEVKKMVQAEMNFVDEKDKELAMLRRSRARPWYARLASPRPHIPNPHPIYVGEDVMIEEFIATTRFSDLPKRSLLGPSKTAISKLAVREGMFQLIYDEWLEPDPHTGNRHALKGGINSLRPKLVVIDLGQGNAQPIELLKPLMRAGLALDAGSSEASARALLTIIKVPNTRSADDVLANIGKGLIRRADAGIIERMMDGLLEAEKLGALVAPEYAPLQKAFLIYTGYSEFLPKDYIFKSLEDGVAARAWRDKTISRPSLIGLAIKRMLFGRSAVRADLETIVEGLATRLDGGTH